MSYSSGRPSTIHSLRGFFGRNFRRIVSCTSSTGCGHMRAPWAGGAESVYSGAVRSASAANDMSGPPVESALRGDLEPKPESDY
jgi:hypothetical protein